MKRYLLFAGYKYYPGGGWKDFENDYDTIEEAENAGEEFTKENYTWYQIIDTTTKEEIKYEKENI